MGKIRDFRTYCPENMKKALKDVTEKGVPARTAASTWNVPRTTLNRLRRQNLTSPRRMGPPTVLTTEEEQLLVTWMLESKDRGFPIAPEELTYSVQKLLNRMNRSTIFDRNLPGKKWVELFEKRHEELSLRTPQLLTVARANITREMIEHWFAETEAYLQKNSLFEILEHPNRIFNCDEAAFLLNPKKKRVYARRGDKTVYQKTGDDKSCITVLLTISASGAKPPPMLVYKYQRIPEDLSQKIPGHWGIGRSVETGWMTSATFFEYITNVFHPWLVQNEVPFPVILFLDGHASHMSYDVSTWCSEHGIELFAFVSNAKQIQQPCDVAAFHPLKDDYKQCVRNWKEENDQCSLTKKDFPPILATALDSLSELTIRNGFQTCGLYPFDCSAIDYTKLLKKKDSQDTNATSSTDTMPNSTVDQCDLKNFITIFERRLTSEQINRFKSASPEDSALANDPLYSFWRNLYAESETPSCSLTPNTDDCNLPATLPIINVPPSSSVTSNFHDWDLPETLPIPPSSSVTSNIDNCELPGTSTIIDVSKTDTAANAPKHFPEPFKHALYWPGAEPESTKTRSTKTREKLPYAVTSEEWQAYHKKKAADKERLEKEKAEQKKIREKKNDKAEALIQKKKEKEEARSKKLKAKEKALQQKKKEKEEAQKMRKKKKEEEQKKKRKTAITKKRKAPSSSESSDSDSENNYSFAMSSGDSDPETFSDLEDLS